MVAAGCMLLKWSTESMSRKEMHPTPVTGVFKSIGLNKDASQGLQPLQEAEELNRGEKKVREEED